MRVVFFCAAIAGLFFIQNSPAQTKSATNSPADVFVKPEPKAPVEIQPGEDGLIHLEAKPELVDLIPTLAVSSLRQAVDFYMKKLGFELVLQSGNYVAVGKDGVQIGFVYDKNASKGYKPSFYIRMAHIDGYYKQILATGVKLTSELKTSSSSMKEFSLVDPDGYTLVFGEYIGR